VSSIKRALENLEAAAEKLGMDEAPTWLLQSPDEDDNRVRENLIHRAADAGLTVQSEVSIADAADYSGIDAPTLKLLIKRGVIQPGGLSKPEIIYGDLIDLMAERHAAKRQVDG